MLLQDLVPSKTEAIPPTHDDGNPEVGCEFFETRQVLGPLAVLHSTNALEVTPVSMPWWSALHEDTVLMAMLWLCRAVL